MNANDVQRLLTAANYYDGAIDNDPGPNTMRAVGIVERNAGGWPSSWPKARRIVAAGQAILNAMGHEAGKVDGLVGHNTREALAAFDAVQHGQDPSFHRPEPHIVHATDWPMNTRSELSAFYGEAGGSQCTAGKVRLPIPFVIAWSPTQTVTRFSCHHLVEDEMTSLFRQAVSHYGEDEYRRLRLDRFGGCFNDRKMRGGSRKSTHAWGVAVDLDPENNRLRWGRDRALFARPEYKAFWEIVEDHGATSLGRSANYDWMHFQFADQV